MLEIRKWKWPYFQEASEYPISTSSWKSYHIYYIHQFHNILIITRVTAEVPWCASKKENLALALLELLVGELDVPLRAFQVFQNIAALGIPCQKMVLVKQNFDAQGGEGVEDQLECGSLLVKIIPFE